MVKLAQIVTKRILPALFVALFLASQAGAQLPVVRGSGAQNAGSIQNSNRLVSDAFSYPFGYGDCTEFRLLDYRVTSDMLDSNYLDGNDIPIHTGEDWNRRVEAGGGGDNDLGDLVCSIGDGVVHSTGSYPTWSNVIVIRHNMPEGLTRWSQYAHLSEILLSEGHTVRRGQVIGRIGKQLPEIACNTTTGEYCAHLHFEIRQQDVDPWNWPRDPEIIQRQYLDPTDIDRDTRPETGFVEANQKSSDSDTNTPSELLFVIEPGERRERTAVPIAQVVRGIINSLPAAEPIQVRARHILLQAGDTTRAAEIKRRIQRGEITFQQAAEQYSLDASNSAQGGDLGWFGSGRMVLPFEEAAFGAERNVVVGPIETRYGLHLLRVDERNDDYLVDYFAETSARYPTFSEGLYVGETRIEPPWLSPPPSPGWCFETPRWSASLSQEASSVDSESFLVASPTFNQSSVWRREATLNERRILTGIGRPHALTEAITLPQNNEPPILVGTFNVLGPGINGPNSLSNQVIIVAEEEHDRYTRVGVAGTLSWQGVDGAVSATIVDVLDVTGDGIPELIFKQKGYEREGYGILRRDTGSWIDVIEWAAEVGC